MVRTAPTAGATHGLRQSPFVTLAEQGQPRPPEPPATPSTLATAQNARTGKTYRNVGTATEEAEGGDTILVSPGLVLQGQNAYYQFGLITIWRPITLKQQIPGVRNRPTLRSLSARNSSYGNGFYGINVRDRAASESGAIVIDGFNFDTFDGPEAIRIEKWQPGPKRSITVRNVRIADATQGVLGGGPGDTLVLENIEAVDCGGFISSYEHPFYVGGDSVTVRGVWSYATKPLGVGRHLFKIRARAAIIEACVFDGQGTDSESCIDIPNGGSYVVRSCVLIQSPQVVENSWANGPIGYGVEGSGATSSSAADWNTWKHSLDLQQNVIITPKPKCLQIVRTNQNTPAFARNFIDNIVMSASDVAWTDFVLKSLNNSRETFTPNYASVFDTSNFAYTRRAGPLSGSRNWTDKRYVHPAAYDASRTDSARGLG